MNEIIKDPFAKLIDLNRQEMDVPEATDFLPGKINHDGGNVPEICSIHL